MDATKLARTLDRLDGLRSREHAATLAGAQPDSGAAAIRARSSGRYVEPSACGFLSVAGDNLLTWRVVIRAGVQPAYGHLTLLRTAIESAVNARWLMDPRLTSAERIARGLAAERASYEEREKFERSLGQPVVMRPPAKTAAQRLQYLEYERAANAIARASVNTVEAARSYLLGTSNGEAAYRLLSAFAHGRQWSLLASEREVIPDTNAAAKTQTGRITAREDVSNGFTAMAVDTYAVGIAELEQYLGIDSA